MNLCTHDAWQMDDPSVTGVGGLRRWSFAACVIVLGISQASRPSAVCGEENLPNNANRVPAQASTTLEKASISFRIGVPQWMPEQRYLDLLALFDKYPGVTDDITFFTSATHPPLPVDEIARRCEILAKRIQEAKKRGYRSGINLLSTMGHHNENLPHSLAADYTRVTDVDGNVSHGSFCPNDPRFLQYVRDIYRLVAKADPDYIWIDDDVRLAGHMPVGETCFCDRCVELFSQETGVAYTRASLKAALYSAPSPERLAARKAWLVHNRATIARLLAEIEKTVHGERPSMPLGFMSGERFYEGYDFDQWANTLAGSHASPVYWRPGGGFYEDSSTAGLVGKSHEIGRQVSLLPASMEVIQSEIENFPYHRLRKSAHVTVLEACSHMAAGCTGAAFNVLSGNDEPLDEFESMVARIHQTRPFFDQAARHFGRATPAGVYACWSKDAWAGADMGMLSQAPVVWEIGLPAAYSPQGAAVTLLFAQNVSLMSDEQLRSVLAGGVYMDADALNAVNQRGFGAMTGMTVERIHSADCIEELTEQALNQPFAGRQRDCRQSFYHLPGCELALQDGRAESLARLVDYAGQVQAPVSMGLFENQLGGRIVVCGYYPWSFLHNLSKTSQMKAVMRWLSRDRLPAYVASFHKANLWARPSSDGGLVVAVTNSSFDAADGLCLALRTDCKSIRVVDMRGNATVVDMATEDGLYRRFTLPPLAPWSMCLVVTEP